MRIEVTQEDIDNSPNPLKTAMERAFGEEVIVDRKFFHFVGHGRERLIKRLPLSAEKFAKRHYTGEQVEPFGFEV